MRTHALGLVSLVEREFRRRRNSSLVAAARIPLLPETIRRPRLSHMLSPSTAFRIAGRVFARGCGGAPREGPEERESEPRRWHALVSRIAAAIPSGSTLRGVTKITWPSGVRCWLQPLVRNGVASEHRAVGHDGRRRANGRRSCSTREPAKAWKRTL